MGVPACGSATRWTDPRIRSRRWPGVSATWRRPCRGQRVSFQNGFFGLPRDDVKKSLAIDEPSYHMAIASCSSSSGTALGVDGLVASGASGTSLSPTASMSLAKAALAA